MRRWALQNCMVWEENGELRALVSPSYGSHADYANDDEMGDAGADSAEDDETWRGGVVDAATQTQAEPLVAAAATQTPA